MQEWTALWLLLLCAAHARSGGGDSSAKFTEAQLHAMAGGAGTAKIDRAYSGLHKKQIDSMQSAESHMSPAQFALGTHRGLRRRSEEE